MGHYDEDYEDDDQRLEMRQREMLLERIKNGYFDMFFHVAGDCKLNYVQIPIDDAKRMIAILRENAIMDWFKR